MSIKDSEIKDQIEEDQNTGELAPSNCGLIKFPILDFSCLQWIFLR
jgi:hypothetical protein